MNILLTGATGTIGTAVARLLNVAGHTVTGLARSQEAADRLAERGLWCARGDLRDLSSLDRAVRDAEAVIHIGMAWGADAGTVDRAAVDAMLQALAGTGKLFIYTSGVWVIGKTYGSVAGELAPVAPPPIVAWRPAVEQSVLNAKERGVRGVVLRPGMVFAASTGGVARMLKSAREEGVVRVVGDGSNHWSLVHLDDVADAYVKAVDKAPAGELFLITDGKHARVREIAEKAARGVPIEFIPIDQALSMMGPIAEAHALDQRVASTKAGRILGWMPKQPGVLDWLDRL